MSHLIVPCLTRRQPWATCSDVSLPFWPPCATVHCVGQTPGCHFTMLTELRRGGWRFMFIASFSQEESVLISLHVTSVQTCRWNAKYPGGWELLGIDSHWSLLFWYLTCVKIGWLMFPVLQTSLVCTFINCVSRGLLQRDDEVMCVPCAKGRCQSPGH